VMGEDIPALSRFSTRSSSGVPVFAIGFQLFVVTALLLTQSFEAVLDFIQFGLTFSSFLTVLGVIVLRRTHPELPRPYKAWGYPLTPVLFLGVTLFVLYHLMTERPLQSLASIATMLVGFLVYAISVRYRRHIVQETH
jgi:APA family basic amino acid/polyamine antiporter